MFSRMHGTGLRLAAACMLALGLSLTAGMPAAAATASNGGKSVDWRHYGNDLLNQRYQDLDQINPSNVSKLEAGMGLPHRRDLRRTSPSRPRRSW